MRRRSWSGAALVMTVVERLSNNEGARSAPMPHQRPLLGATARLGAQRDPGRERDGVTLFKSRVCSFRAPNVFGQSLLRHGGCCQAMSFRLMPQPSCALDFSQVSNIPNASLDCARDSRDRSDAGVFRESFPIDFVPTPHRFPGRCGALVARPPRCRAIVQRQSATVGVALARSTKTSGGAQAEACGVLSIARSANVGPDLLVSYACVVGVRCVGCMEGSEAIYVAGLLDFSVGRPSGLR